jgi:hypothetical protein
MPVDDQNRRGGFMPNVIPSQVVLVIAKFFSHVTRPTPGDGLIQAAISISCRVSSIWYEKSRLSL